MWINLFDVPATHSKSFMGCDPFAKKDQGQHLCKSLGMNSFTQGLFVFPKKKGV